MIRKLSLKLIFSALVFFMSLSTVYAQVSLREISLKEQIDNSSLVIEGEVISQRSFWGPENKSIYTAYTVDVFKVFKGERVSQIEVVTIGGSVGLNTLLVSHGLKLGKGSTGIFTLYDSDFIISSKNTTKNKQFKAYSGIQGFYAYNLEENSAVNPFSKRKGIKKLLYKEVLKITKGSYKTVTSFDIESIQKKSIQNNSSPPTGISFSPTTITAGTGSVLTIEGSGFGADKGKVGFRNADDGGASFFDALDSQVLSWADDLITVEVPVINTNDASIAGTAGTGTIRVTDSNGISNTSNESLIINSAQINVPFDAGSGVVQAFQTQHHDGNGSGGYTWVMEDDFFNGTTHPDASAAFLRAFDSWRCETKVNWEVSGSSTNTSDIGTTENIITFDIDGTDSELPAGTLGTCYYSAIIGDCDSGIIVYITDLDIVFDRETNWYFGTGEIAGKFDFETVALHELGHGHQLGHVINASNVMHYQLPPEIINTVLDASSIDAANDVQSRSTIIQTGCFPFNSMTDYTGTCGLNVEDFSLENSISLYPNPTKQEFFIKSTVVNLDKVEVYDVSGRLISQIEVTDSSRIISVNLIGASKGMYFVNIYSEGSFFTKKILLE